MSRTVYDLLTKTTVSELTVAHLNTATGRTAIDLMTREFWVGIMTLSHILRASRTYAPASLPIPESGAIWTQEIANGGTANVQPSGTEIWQVENIGLDNCAVAFNDGTSISSVSLDATNPNRTFLITNTLFLTFQNASGSSQDPTVAYSKVGL